MTDDPSNKHSVTSPLPEPALTAVCDGFGNRNGSEMTIEELDADLDRSPPLVLRSDDPRIVAKAEKIWAAWLARSGR